MGLQSDMNLAPVEANRIQRLLQRVGATGIGTAAFSAILGPLDRLGHRLSKGRTTAGRSLGGLPVVMLTTIGARTGQKRTTPINVIPHGEDLALVASNYGRGTVPAWAHNLRANPAASLTFGGRDYRVVAREVGGSHYEQAFAAAITVYPGYARYRRKASNFIPIFVLTAEGSA